VYGEQCLCQNPVRSQSNAYENSPRTDPHVRHGEEFGDLIFSHYEQFNSQYKSLLPLKRIYVAAPVAED